MTKEKNLNIEKIFNLALVNHKENKFENAEKHYKQLLKIDPTHFNATYLLGTLFFQQNKLKDAKKIFESAILINAGHAELCNNYGATLTQLGEYKSAINILQKAIYINPNYAEAYNNLGAALRELREYQKAIIFFEKANKLKPNFIDPYLNLGIVFKELANFKKAIFFFKSVIKIKQNNTKAYQNLMELYEKTNQEKELNDIIVIAKKFIKHDPIIKLYEAIIFYNNNEFIQAKNLLESIFFESLNIKNEIIRVTTLAKCFDRIGNGKAAFNYFVKANNLAPKLRKLNLYNKNRYLTQISSRINFFKQANIKKWKVVKPKNKRPDPIFLIGFPRSGTTLLDTVLRSHPAIEVVEEKPTVNSLINCINEMGNEGLKSLANINEKEIEKIQNVYFKSLDNQIQNKNATIYIDKLPLNIIHVGEIVRIFPNSKFILSVRHPYDCVLSCFMQDFELNDAMANFLDIKDSAQLYDYVMRLWFKYLSIFQIRYHEVKYENLIGNFKKTTELVLSFLDLPWDDAVFNYSTTAKKREAIATPSYNQVTKPLYSHADGRWKKYEKQISSIYPILNQWIKKFKY